MNTQLMETLADILADALLADLECEEEQGLAVATGESLTGSGSRAEHRVATTTSAQDAA
jgi:hypothetical protein